MSTTQATAIGLALSALLPQRQPRAQRGGHGARRPGAIDGDIAKADFGTKAMLPSAAAWSPDPRNPPSYFDLPIASGKPVPTVIAAWAANAPLTMVYQFIPNLKTYDAIAFDAGDRDVGIADTVRSLDRILTAFGVEHVAQIYEGNHIDHIIQQRPPPGPLARQATL